MGAETLTALRSELERVLLGKSGGPYDSQMLPTKVCLTVCLFSCLLGTHALPWPIYSASQAPGRSQVESLFKATPPPLQSAKTLQMINIHKASLLFRNLATSPSIGEAVCALMGWSGVRFCQDQVCLPRVLNFVVACGLYL